MLNPTVRLRVNRHITITAVVFFLLLAAMYILGEANSVKSIFQKGVEAVAAATMDLMIGLFRAAE